ncbi:MAG: hypothetical protein PHO53_02890 [Actinomycetota bacterium]|nr:hypothetical protein [Actinomycetota bacterium]
MNKRITASIFVVLMVLTLFSIGCGGEKEKAQQFMKEGDSFITKADGKSKRLEDAIDTLGEKLTPNATSQEIKSLADPIDEVSNEILIDIGKAKESYEKIVELGNVGAYKDYAKTQIELIDKESQMVTEFMRMLDQLEEFYQDIERGIQRDQNEFLASLESIEERVHTLRTECDNLRQKVKDIKKKNKL